MTLHLTAIASDDLGARIRRDAHAITGLTTPTTWIEATVDRNDLPETEDPNDIRVVVNVTVVRTDDPDPIIRRWVSELTEWARLGAKLIEARVDDANVFDDHPELQHRADGSAPAKPLRTQLDEALEALEATLARMAQAEVIAAEATTRAAELMTAAQQLESERNALHATLETANRQRNEIMRDVRTEVEGYEGVLRAVVPWVAKLKADSKPIPADVQEVIAPYLPPPDGQE